MKKISKLGIVKTCHELDLWKRLTAPTELDQKVVGPNVNQLIETRQILNGEVPRLQKLMLLKKINTESSF